MALYNKISAPILLEKAEACKGIQRHSCCVLKEESKKEKVIVELKIIYHLYYMEETWHGMKGRALFAVEDVRFHVVDNIQKYEVTSKKHSCSARAMISI